MRRYTQIFALAIVLLLKFGGVVDAQSERGNVKVEIVLSRYEGTRKVSSLPYTFLAAPGGGNVSVRMGAQVPVASQVGTDNKATNFTYQAVGTNIDCKVDLPDNGRYKVLVNLNDSSVLEKQPPAAPGSPVTLRNFTYNNSVYLKDGETKQFVAATDKAIGDVVKIDVTLTVEK
jgi:hypothetical protein